MKKVSQGSVSVDMWPLHQKISGMAFVNPNIPALKYGRVMEEDAVNCFYNKCCRLVNRNSRFILS